MWFLFQQPEIFLDYWQAEHDRAVRTALAQRALRGSTPPFDARMQEKLEQAMTERPSAARLAGQRP